MAIEPNTTHDQNNTSKAAQAGANDDLNGIVTVNDDNNPTPEERDAKIPNEPDTERLRSERQSVEEGKRSQ